MSDHQERDRRPGSKDDGEHTLDPELIAALIDGRLGAAERAALLAEVDASDEAFDLLVGAAAAVRSLDVSAGAPAASARSSAGRRWRSGAKPWLALAAGIAGIALAPWGWARLRGDDTDPGRFAASLQPSELRIAEVTRSRPWSATRGAGSSLATPARAARIGALVTDVDLTIRARPSVARESNALTTQLLGELIGLLEQTPGGGAGAAAYRNVREHATDPNVGTLTAAARAAAVGIDPLMVDLGAWAEAALYATATGDTAFFTSRSTGRLIDRAAGSSRLSETARAAVAAVQTDMRPPVNAGRLTVDVREVLRGLAE